MSDPTVSSYWNQTTPAPPAGDQACVIQTDNAIPQDSRTVYPQRATSALYGTTKLPIRKVVLSFPSPATGAVKAFVQVDFSGTIVGWAAFGDGSSGSLSVDVWKKAGTPPPTATAPSIPTVTDKISASAPVAIASALSAASGTSGVSTWTTAVAAGDSITFSVASVTTFTSITVELYIQQS